MSRILSLIMLVGLIVFCAKVRAAEPVTYLTNPGVYTAIPSSTFSDFPGQVVENLFDTDPESLWAIDSFAGNNPQGRDEGWISVTLDQIYLITDLRFAPRKATADTDAIDALLVWVSPTPFPVDVTSAASTEAFLATSRGGNPDLSLGPFASFAPVDYAFDETLKGKYVVARFLNVSDLDNNRNLGGRTFHIGQVGTIPEPSTVVLLAGLVCAVLPRRGVENVK